MTDQKLYDRPLDELYGQPAEGAVLKFLEAREDVDRAEHFPYGEKDVDIKVIQGQNKCAYFIDVERRKNWVWPQMFFPFSSIHIPYRKRGMILNRQPFYYFAVRDDCQRIASIPGSVILGNDVFRSRNKYDSAKFFIVPVENIYYWEVGG